MGSKKSRKEMRINFLDDVDYSFMLIISSFRILGSARDDRLSEDDLYSLSLAMYHFVNPILEEVKECLFEYRDLLKEKGKRNDRRAGKNIK